MDEMAFPHPDPRADSAQIPAPPKSSEIPIPQNTGKSAGEAGEIIDDPYADQLV
jgi:hypothetical protein